MKMGELKEAGQVITDLIVSKVAPRTFWSTLFDNALELLDPINGELLIGRESTYQLIEILETVTIELECVKSKSFIDEHSNTDDIFTDKLIAFRLALIRNLAKAIVYSSP